MDRDSWSVDGQLFEVGPAVAVQLRVEVGEDAALDGLRLVKEPVLIDLGMCMDVYLEKGILGEIDPADNMTRLEL